MKIVSNVDLLFVDVTLHVIVLLLHYGTFALIMYCAVSN
jgi:hypothetical protein